MRKQISTRIWSDLILRRTFSSSISQNIIVEKSNGITTIILNRPEVKNAINFETAKQLAAAFRSFESDSDAKVAILCGNGDSFCAGADLTAISQGDLNELSLDKDAPLGPSRLEISKPIIGAISGYAVAGGLELSLLCDLRVIEEDVVFGVFCRKWGVPLIDGGTVRLPRLIGLSRALDLILTGRSVTAQEAYSIGLANRLVPKGQSRVEAEKLAQLIASFPQECMLTDRKSAYSGLDLPMKVALERELIEGKKIVENSTSFFQSVSKFHSRTK